MLDNGAFSAKTQGRELDVNGFYAWVEPNLEHPHWAVIPDVIDGTLDQQKELLRQWPFGDFGAPVWHMNEPLDWLLELSDKWPRICIGSAGEYWQVGNPAWSARMDKAFNAMAKAGVKPWIHGLRMLSQVDGGWPLASADSTNVAQNFSTRVGCAECMANLVDSAQPSIKWKIREEQTELFN